MYMERRRSDRNHVYVVHQHGYGSRAGPSGSQSNSYASHYGSHQGGSRDVNGYQQGPAMPAMPTTPVTPMTPVAPAQPPAQPSPQPTIPEDPPATSQPVPMNDQTSFTTQPGYQTVVQPVSGGRSVRVSVATGYTANGAANEAAGQAQASGYNPNQAAGPAANPEDDGYGATGYTNGWGLSWGQPDQYGRQYLHPVNSIYPNNFTPKHYNQPANMASHDKPSQKTKYDSSKEDKWDGAYFERKRSDRGMWAPRRLSHDSKSSKSRGRSPERYGDPSGSRYEKNHRSSLDDHRTYQSNCKSGHHSCRQNDYYDNRDSSPQRSESSSYGASHYGSDYAGPQGTYAPRPQQAMRARSLIPEEPTVTTAEPPASRSERPGYRMVEVQTATGPMQVSVATGYTSNGVAHEADVYQNLSRRTSHGNQYQVPGNRRDNPTNQYYQGRWY
ncbi:hypothetical protein F4774DRAFT_409770 [Daldinia eschscholtzii]|nr:hypothetical protein F4774DRAFT_409770 [Daldinia eschscholtzii]